jgi:glycosyltransferase involved in cell wall biosynthesis
MHVLVVPSWYPTTEAPLQGIYFAEQARMLHEHGLTMGVVYPEHQSLRRLSAAALRRNHFQTEWTIEEALPTLRRHGWNVWWRFPPGVRLRIRSAVRLARQYADRHGVPDLIHAHSARWAGAAAARIGEALAVPYVLTEHYSGLQRDAVPAWRWPLVEEGIRHASGLAAVSAPLRDTMARRTLADPASIDLIPNPVCPAQFSLPDRPRPSPPPLRLVTVAHLNARKNLSGLLEAFRTAFDTSPDVSLTIVGDGPQRAALSRQASRLGLGAQVSFLGAQPRTGVREALWNAHAFVLASRHETFGVVVVEALATGLPVVATRCGGPEDIVTKQTGRLVPPDDPEALAEALCTLREEWTSYNPEHIRASVLARYGPEPFVQRTRSLYRQARADA